jgi:hypothetical protein
MSLEWRVIGGGIHGVHIAARLLGDANVSPERLRIVDPNLRWHPRVFVSGPLAELELGPVSRNIAGARRAGDRIVNAIRSNLAAGA